MFHPTYPSRWEAPFKSFAFAHRGLLEFAEGNRVAAQASFDKANAIAEDLPNVSGSDFGKALDKLKLVLAH